MSGAGAATGGPPPDWRPPYAYVPGRSLRHPEGLFDPIRQGLAHDRLERSAAWAFGLAFLREGYFWEAHEVLEAVWMACPPNGPERLLVQGIVQIANARLKLRMGRPRAAARLDAIAEGLVAEAFRRSPPPILSLGPAEVRALRDPESWAGQGARDDAL